MNVRAATPTSIPLWSKIACTAWVAVLVPVWIVVQGPQNFLWLSDIGLLGTCVALWLEHRLLASMLALAVILPDLGWTCLFLGRLIVDAGPLERSGFMFDAEIPLWIRGLSLFHILLPPLLVVSVRRLGYDSRALWAQTLFTGGLLLVVMLATEPADNLNFVFGFGDPPQPPLPQPWWPAAQAIILFVAAYLPTHFFLRWFSGHQPSGAEQAPQEGRLGM